MKRKIVLGKQLPPIIILYIIIMVFLYSLVNIKTPSILMMSISFVLTFLLFEDQKRQETFLNDLCLIVEIISITGLFFFVFGTVLNLVKPTGYYSDSQIGWGRNTYYSYYNVIFSGANSSMVSANIFGYIGVPNYAIFTEPPMYAYFLITVLYVELNMLPGKLRISRIILVVISCLSTFSTNAYLGMVICFSIYIYTHMGAVKKIRVIIAPVGYIAYEILSAKAINKAMSFNVRVDDILTCFKCFVQHPLIGVGFENAEALDQYRLIYRHYAASSSGIMSILAYGGIVWGIWYIVPFIIAVKRFIGNSGDNEKKKLGFIIISFILLFNVSIHNRMISSVVFSLAWLYVTDPYKRVTYRTDSMRILRKGSIR